MRQADTEARSAVLRSCAPACVACEDFRKNAFTFHSSLSTGLLSASAPTEVSHTFHRFCESNVKRPQRFAHARNAREPLFTGLSHTCGEGERNFSKMGNCLTSFAIKIGCTFAMHPIEIDVFLDYSASGSKVASL